MKQKRVVKGILSVILTLAMVLGAVPLPFIPASMVVHAEGDTRTVEIEATNQDISNATTWENCTVNITGSGTVTYSKRITITGEVTLNLGEGVTLIASKGIAVNEGNSLTIEGTGSLQAYSENDAAIGGDNNHSAGSITINSGSITTNNSGHAAGIGGGRGGSAGTITINGGNVNAHGGTQSAGIGGGAASQSGGDPGGGGTIIIRGGQIKATCDTRYANYIGCGIGPGKADGNVFGTEGTISLAWGNDTDYIDAYSYVGTICFEGGKKFFYDGTTEYVTSEGLYQKNKKIVPAIVDNSSLAFAEIRMPKSYVTDNGSEVDVSYEVYDSNDNKLTLGVDYSAVIKNSENTEVSVFNQWGDYTLTVTGMGNYHDSQSYVFSLAEWDKELTEDGSEHYINLPEYQSKTVYLNKNQCIKVYDSEGKDGALKVSDGRLIIHAPEGYALQVTGKTDAMKYNEIQARNINSLSAYEGEDLSYEIISLLTNSENISFVSGGSTMLIRLNVASLQTGYTHYGLELNVTVVKAESHSITVADNINGGNIESNKTSAYTNDSVTLTVNPDMGYLLKRITVTDTSTGDTIKTIGEDQWFSGGDTVSLQMMNQDVTLTPEFTNDLTTNGLSTLNFAETGEREYVIPTGVQSFKIAGSPYRNSTTATNISTTIIRAQSGDILQATGNVDFYNNYYDRSKIEIYDGSNISAPLLKIIEGENKDVESIGTVNSSGDSLKFCLYEYGIYNMSFTGIIEVKHRHHFSYSSDGTTITAICDRSDCDLTDRKASVTIEAPTGDLTYDVTVKMATITGDTEAFGDLPITYTKNGEVLTGTPRVAGTYTASFSAGGKTASVDYTISPKSVTITGLNVSDKTYDGTTTAEVSGTATIEGKVENDDVRVAAGTAAFSDANAGTGKTVTFSGWALTGADKDNYTLAAQPESVTADIDKADTSITVGTSSYSKTYGDAAFTLTGITTTPADASLTYTVSDSKNAANESVENNKVITVDENGKVTIVGAGSAKITVALPESQNHNAAESKIIDVTVAKCADPAVVTTTATLQRGKTLDLSSLVSGAQGAVSFALKDGHDGGCSLAGNTLTSGVDAGTCTVNVTIAGSENYNEKTATIEVTVIEKTEQTISFASDAQTKVYGDGDFTVAATHSVGDGEVSYGIISGTSVAAVDDTGKVHILKAGTATIKATAAETDSYASATAQYILTVNPLTLGITWSETDFSYDGNVHKPTAVLTGVKSGDVCGVSVAGGKIDAGNSYIATASLTGTDKGNYTIPTADKSCAFKIKKVTPTVTTIPTASGITYGHTLTDSTLSGGVAKVNGTAVAGTFAWADDTVKPAVSDSNKTQYTVNFTPTDTTNYEATTCKVKVSVAQKEVKLVWGTDTEFTFDGKSHAPTVTISEGLLTGDTVTVTVSGAKTNVGTDYTATASGLTGTKAGNYKLPTEKTTAFSIVKASAQTLTNVTADKYFGLTSINASVAGKMPSNAGALSYTKGTATKTGAVTVSSWSVDASGKITATISGGVKGNTITFPVIITSDNYADSTVNVVVTLTDCPHENTELRGAIEETCTKKGYTGDTYCLDCGEKIATGEAIDLLDHTPAEPVKENEVAPKCEEKGSYDEVIYCSVCGAEISREKRETNPIGHDWGEWVVTTPATETEEGVETCVCKNDETHTDTRPIPKLDHVHKIVPVDEIAPTCTKDGTKAHFACEGCELLFEDEAGEKEITDESTLVIPAAHKGGKATCAKGAICEVCGEEYGEKDPANHTGETEIKNVVEPTCTKQGYTGDICCKDCGVKLADGETTDATGHKQAEPVKENEIAATCKAEGSYETVIYCEVCKEELTRGKTILSKLKHEWDEGKITKEATYTEAGVKTYTCTLCGETREEEVPQLEVKDLTKCTTTNITDKVYNGKLYTPAIVVKYDGKSLKKGKDYTVKYSCNKLPGTATVKITGINGFKGTITKTFTIKPRATSVTAVIAGDNCFTVKWGKRTTGKTTGYQIQYGTNKRFAKGTFKYATIKTNTTIKKKVTKLASGKTYYVRVRTFRTVNGKNVYSAWSDAMSVKIK